MDLRNPWIALHNLWIHTLRRNPWIAQESVDLDCLRDLPVLRTGLLHTQLHCSITNDIIARLLCQFSCVPAVKPSSDADGLWFCSVDYRGQFSPLKCVKLFNFRLVEITNPSMYVCANCIVSYAKFMDRPARSTDSCAIHGFLRNVWIHRLRSAIHGLRRSTDCVQQ